MADEIVGEVPAPNPAQERITQLSDKVKQEAEARTAAEAAKADAEKRAVFAEGFVDMVGTYPAAKEFKADIQAKVMSGYSIEDATLAVLGKAGKLGGSAPAPSPSPAGGSAPTTLPQRAEKPIEEMSSSEKRQALADLLG